MDQPTPLTFLDDTSGTFTIENAGTPVPPEVENLSVIGGTATYDAPSNTHTLTITGTGGVPLTRALTSAGGVLVDGGTSTTLESNVVISLPVGPANTVWGSNGSANAWTTAPVVTSITATGHAYVGPIGAGADLTAGYLSFPPGAASILFLGSLTISEATNPIISFSSTAGISVSTQRIHGVVDPSAAQDVATKNYVDSVAVGLQIKGAVKAVSVSNVASTSGLAVTVDGVALDTDGYRVLLTAQTSGIDDGIWVVHSGAWTRSTDMAAASHAAGSFAFVTGGTLYGNTGWACTTLGPTDVVGTDGLTFTEFSAAGQVLAGAGLTKTGSTLDVVAANGSITVNADSIQVGTISDSNHGTRGGGTQHATVTTSLAGFAPAASSGNQTALTIDGSGVIAWNTVTNSQLAGGIAASKLAIAWNSTLPSVAARTPSLIKAGAFIGLTWDPGDSSIAISTNVAIADWHITGGADVVPNRVDTGAGLIVTSDGTGGVILATNGVKFVNDDELYSVTDGNGYRHSELTTRGIVPLANNTVVTLAQVTETESGMTGSIYSADFPNLNVFVEIEVSTEGLIPGTYPALTTREDRAVYYCHLTSTYYSVPWQLAITMYENESLRSPAFSGSEVHPWSSLELVRSGTNNTIWTIQATCRDFAGYTFKWPTVAYKLRVLGEGRFVVT